MDFFVNISIYHSLPDHSFGVILTFKGSNNVFLRLLVPSEISMTNFYA